MEAVTADNTGRGVRLAVDDVRIGYGAVEAIHGVSLTAEPGTLTALVGVNGAGKTTLLKGVMGLLPKRSGTVTLGSGEAEERIDALPAHAVVRRGVALVPEGRGMLATMTVAENLETAGYLVKGRSARRARMEEVMERFPRLAERRDQLTGTLSGGEQQMVAIGRALMLSPRLLLLDEPSLGLAPVIVRDVIEMIAAIRDEGTTVVLVEQNTRVALQLASYVYVLEHGQVAFAGRPDELEASGELAALYLGGTTAQASSATVGTVR